MTVFSLECVNLLRSLHLDHRPARKLNKQTQLLFLFHTLFSYTYVGSSSFFNWVQFERGDARWLEIKSRRLVSIEVVFFYFSTGGEGDFSI